MMRSISNMRRGFSLVELLLAIFILGIGVISVAAIFPAGIAQQQQSRDDLMGPVVASQAVSMIRAKVGQDDFGTFEQFGLSAWMPRMHLPSDARNTIPGDWGWMRPSFLLDPATVGMPPAANPYPDPLHGAIDIFGLRHTRSGSAVPGVSFDQLVDTADEDQDNDFMTTSDMTTALAGNYYGVVNGAQRSTDPLFPPFNSIQEPTALAGIPFNRAKYLILSDHNPPGTNIPPDYRMNPNRQGRVEPLVTITQGERSWPQGEERPEYYWDCLFRRYQGRIQVAIFVYRVGFGGEGARTYTVSAHTSNANSNAWPNESPLPARVDLAVVDRWLPTGVDDTSRLDDHVVPATAPSGAVLGPHLDPYELGWQYPGQWILDQNGNVHRVFKGRRSFADGPVQLAQPVPYIPQQAASGNLFDDSGNLIDDPATASAVKSIWFIPPETGNGVFLTPIFVMVRDL